MNNYTVNVRNPNFGLGNRTFLCSVIERSDFGHSGHSVWDFLTKLDHFMYKIYFYDPKKPKRSSLLKTSQNRTFGFGPVDQPNIQNPNDFKLNHFDLSEIQTSSDFGHWQYVLWMSDVWGEICQLQHSTFLIIDWHFNNEKLH